MAGYFAGPELGASGSAVERVAPAGNGAALQQTPNVVIPPAPVESSASQALEREPSTTATETTEPAPPVTRGTAADAARRSRSAAPGTERPSADRPSAPAQVEAGSTPVNSPSGDLPAASEPSRASTTGAANDPVVSGSDDPAQHGKIPDRGAGVDVKITKTPNQNERDSKKEGQQMP